MKVRERPGMGGCKRGGEAGSWRDLGVFCAMITEEEVLVREKKV